MLTHDQCVAELGLDFCRAFLELTLVSATSVVAALLCVDPWFFVRRFDA